MPYNPNIPQPNDNLSDSQNDLLNNFSALDTSFDKNHYTYSNATANNGKHKFCEMPIGSLPVGLAANEATIYGKTATSISTSSEGNLWYTPDNSGKEYQLTRTVSDGVSFPKFGASSGWTFLPGGLLMQWGKVNSTTENTSISQSFPIAFSTTVYNISFGMSVSGNTNHVGQVYVVGTPGTGSFNWCQSDLSGSATGFFWVAIGK